MENEEIVRIISDQNENLGMMMSDLLTRVRPPEKPDHPGRSETTAKLDEAMGVATGLIQVAHKDANNPFHNSTYADLASCWDACRDALSKNGLSVRQFTIPHRDRYMIRLITKLSHKSGEWESGVLDMRCQARRKDGGWVDDDGPQTIGAVITYARRYGLCAIVGIAPSDRDAEPESTTTTDKELTGKAPIKEAETKKKPPAKKEEKKAVSNDGAMSAGNVAKLKKALGESGLSEESTKDLFDLFKVSRVEELPKDAFVKFTRCLSKAKEIEGAEGGR